MKKRLISAVMALAMAATVSAPLSASAADKGIYGELEY